MGLIPPSRIAARLEIADSLFGLVPCGQHGPSKQQVLSLAFARQRLRVEVERYRSCSARNCIACAKTRPRRELHLAVFGSSRQTWRRLSASPTTTAEMSHSLIDTPTISKIISKRHHDAASAT